jgi:hypothetical protein
VKDVKMNVGQGGEALAPGYFHIATFTTFITF